MPAFGQTAAGAKHISSSKALTAECKRGMIDKIRSFVARKPSGNLRMTYLKLVGKARLLCCYAMSTTESYFSDVYWPPLEGCLLHFSLLSCSFSRSGSKC